MTKDDKLTSAARSAAQSLADTARAQVAQARSDEPSPDRIKAEIEAKRAALDETIDNLNREYVGDPQAGSGVFFSHQIMLELAELFGPSKDEFEAAVAKSVALATYLKRDVFSRRGKLLVEIDGKIFEIKNPL